MCRISYRFLVPGWSAKPLVSAHDRIMGTHTLRMLKGAANDWDHLSWRDQVRDVLTTTNDATDPEAIENRTAIVDHYIERGDHDFRVYIPSQP